MLFLFLHLKLRLIEAYALRSKDWVVFTYIILLKIWVTEFLRMEIIVFPFWRSSVLIYIICLLTGSCLRFNLGPKFLCFCIPRIPFTLDGSEVGFYIRSWNCTWSDLIWMFLFFPPDEGRLVIKFSWTYYMIFLLFQRSWRLLESRPISWMQMQDKFDYVEPWSAEFAARININGKRVADEWGIWRWYFNL